MNDTDDRFDEQTESCSSVSHEFQLYEKNTPEETEPKSTQFKVSQGTDTATAVVFVL